MIDAAERLINLALYLGAARGDVTAERIRTDVAGYDADVSEDAFKRMLERDKDGLRRMGLEIESDAEGRYRLNAAATFASAVDLTPVEAATVRVAGSALLADVSFPFAEDLRLALAKVAAALQTGSVAAAARLADERPAEQGETVSVLTSASTACKRVAFGYTNSLGESGPHEVEPYGLFLHDGRWYLVGRDIAKNEVRTYAVTRMTDACANTEKPKHPDFERPADFDVADFVRLPFQYGRESDEFPASVAFTPAAAWRAKSVSGGLGEIDEQPDGSVRWRVGSRSRRRLVQFVIENGPGLAIEGPDETAALHAEALRKAVAAHG